MIISKEQFEEAIEKFKAFSDYINELADYNVNIWEADAVGYFEDMYINILSWVIGEEHREDFMYFICDANCGDGPGTYFDGKNGERVWVSNPSEFYDFISGNYENLDTDFVAD
ncbi:MAG: hypothetical protein IJH34_17315 [Romboutsia sp.]|nr:hypothetical protein [Romboutsia sp.]